MTIWDHIATERRTLADDLAALTDDQWAAPSQCDAWTVRDTATHLVVPFEVSTVRLIFTLARHRFNIDRAAIDLTARVRSRTTKEDIVASLRANADNRWTPPGYGAEIPLAEIVVHGQDIRRPLGLDNPTSAETTALALEGVKDDEVLQDYARRLGVSAPTDRRG